MKTNGEVDLHDSIEMDWTLNCYRWAQSNECIVPGQNKALSSNKKKTYPNVGNRKKWRTYSGLRLPEALLSLISGLKINRLIN